MYARQKIMKSRTAKRGEIKYLEKAKRELEKQEGNIAVLSFGTEESAEVVIGEINKTEQYTQAHTNQENMSREESKKDQNMANQGVKQYYA